METGCSQHILITNGVFSSTRAKYSLLFFFPPHPQIRKPPLPRQQLLHHGALALLGGDELRGEVDGDPCAEDVGDLALARGRQHWKFELRVEFMLAKFSFLLLNT